jgi:cell wall assembly regulator SMI1
MTPLEAVRNAEKMDLTIEDGVSSPLELMPGLSESEITEFEKTLPCKLPAEVRELLAYCRGFSGSAAEIVDFTGQDCSFEYTDAFPHGLPIAADGFGNFWVVDLFPSSTTWGPIYYACHDAPVILYQSPSLVHFLSELFKMSVPPRKSLVDDVHEDRLFDVWSKNPGVKSHGECMESGDPTIKSFANELGPTFEVIDLRNAPIGFGLSWGRYGANPVARRCGELPIFAYEKKLGFFAKLFGRKS